MSKHKTFRIDPLRPFPHLKNAPIVEAIIDVRARAESDWKEDRIAADLKSAALADYASPESQRGFTLDVKLDLAGVRTGSATEHQDLGWMGFRFSSKDHKQVVAFTRDGFSFSRLAPYQDWAQLKNEALRLWEIHSCLAQPTAVQRVGLRFINRIEVPSTEFNLQEYYADFAPTSAGLPMNNFFHHDVLAVPGYPYRINIIRTIQPGAEEQSQLPALILDVDVFTSEPFSPRIDIIKDRLEEMRSLKNHVFFESLTPEAISQCQ